MLKNVKAKTINAIVVTVIIASELYLMTTGQNEKALFVAIAVVVLWGLLSFVYNKKIGSMYFQKEIMRYLYKNKKKGKKEDIIQYFQQRSPSVKKESIEEVVSKAIEKLKKKNKIFQSNSKLKVN